MDKTILKLATLNNSARLNMQRLREERDEALNDAKDNDTTKTIEELYVKSKENLYAITVVIA